MIDMRPADEAALGAREFDRLLASSRTLPPDAPASRLVTRVARRIAAVVPPGPTPLEWRFVVVAAPGVVNAACYPGGKVVVFSGLLDALPPGREGEAELAAVLAHEVGHAVARHSAEKLSFANVLLLGRMVLFFVIDAGALVDVLINVAASLPMSRAMEAEADYIGLHLMAAACYDPAAAARFFTRLDAMAGARGVAPPAFLSTHPSDKRRVAKIEGWLPDVSGAYETGCARVSREGLRGLDGALGRESGRGGGVVPVTRTRRRRAVAGGGGGRAAVDGWGRGPCRLVGFRGASVPPRAVRPLPACAGVGLLPADKRWWFHGAPRRPPT
ncbi:hypothetical protein BU14_0084s0012 [Porphyra umbilicalis]|uniref:Peptidase M48 domain-containing protein n=1 Tax=Porphyra umbilicalis TaxID=2786 RepID=A0A1X6PEB9_PORUM|nr:hypothetical protein BU14_0084s0012 [Porphyra umbilicalis]|eukprot:OSX79198.1 hypothetical protein BU14_0084s0012 [Porphyra umbilicalis]